MNKIELFPVEHRLQRLRERLATPDKDPAMVALKPVLLEILAVLEAMARELKWHL